MTSVPDTAISGIAPAGEETAVGEAVQAPGAGSAHRPPSGRLSRRPSRWRSRRLWVAAAALVAVLVLAVAHIRSASPWQTVWSDDFDGSAESLPSSQNWQVTTGTGYPGGAAAWGTGEVETYTANPANLGLDGSGHLRITPVKDAAGAWTSARVETRRSDFQAPAGGMLKVEARIQVSSGGQGIWPAFWMLGDSFRGTYTNWPQVGEIDVMENVGKEPSIVHGTFHCGVNPGGPCNETDGRGGSYTMPDGSALAAGMHTYGVEWDRSNPAAEQLRWYLDGHLFATVHSGDVDAASWAAATHHGFFLLLNVAVGGAWPGLPDSATRSGASMLVDSVTVSRASR